jgi:hypothetical protein
MMRHFNLHIEAVQLNNDRLIKTRCLIFLWDAYKLNYESVA